MARACGAWLAAVLLLAGCAQAPAPPERFFRLLPELPARLERTPLPGTLLVKRFAADGLLAQRPLVYAGSASPGSLFQYNWSFWADPPTVLMRDVVVDALRAANAATRVVTPELDVRTDHTLVGRIRRLEHLVGDTPSVAVWLELAVHRSRDRSLLLVRDYRATRPVSGTGPGAAVVALNDAVAEVLVRFVADLEGL